MNVTDSFFQQRPDIKPIIYAYELVDVDSHNGCIKVGETTRSDFEGWQFVGRGERALDGAEDSRRRPLCNALVRERQPKRRNRPCAAS